MTGPEFDTCTKRLIHWSVNGTLRDMAGLGEQRPDLDLPLMGEFLRAAASKTPGIRTLNPGLRNATREGHEKPVSPNVISNARHGRPQVELESWRRLEEPFDYAMDTFVAVGEHDFDDLEGMGVPTELVQWLRRTVTPTATGSNQTG